MMKIGLHLVAFGVLGLLHGCTSDGKKEQQIEDPVRASDVYEAKAKCYLNNAEDAVDWMDSIWHWCAIELKHSSGDLSSVYQFVDRFFVGRDCRVLTKLTRKEFLKFIDLYNDDSFDAVSASKQCISVFEREKNSSPKKFEAMLRNVENSRKKWEEKNWHATWGYNYYIRAWMQATGVTTRDLQKFHLKSKRINSILDKFHDLAVEHNID